MSFAKQWRLPLVILVATLVATTLVAPAPAAKKPPKTPTAGAQMSFGVDMAKRGLWSEALFRFKLAYRMDPSNPKTLNNLAVAYEAVGLFEEANHHYQKALRASPSNRDLKKNYSRFVEFYQGFKPAGEDPAAETASDDMRREG